MAMTHRPSFANPLNVLAKPHETPRSMTDVLYEEFKFAKPYRKFIATANTKTLVASAVYKKGTKT
jgi:hypothetical protein